MKPSIEPCSDLTARSSPESQDIEAVEKDQLEEFNPPPGWPPPDCKGPEMILTSGIP
jgi:hypothetical protein